MAQACLSNLLQTAIKANFLFLPFATSRLKSATHAALVFLAEKLHLNSLPRIKPPPILVMRTLPRMLVPELCSRGDKPAIAMAFTLSRP
jgi:hypothetical protein